MSEPEDATADSAEGAAAFAALPGRSAVVTGASSGIGRAIAIQLAKAGADLLITCRSSRESLERSASDCREFGGRVETFVGDLADPFVRAELERATFERFGVPHVVVNNAGVDLLTGSESELAYGDKLRRLFEVDIAVTVEVAKSFGLRMAEAARRDGAPASRSIINIGWDLAEVGMEGDSGELFATAKNAVMGFTRSLAVSLAPDVRVNCVAPGWIQTAWGEGASEYWQQRVIDETPLRRWGTPEDIAKAIRFLASDDASFITGQVINVNGGAAR
ncbi:SDR family NAD(P)-dependent oxidoreductase [Stratiformator vulcanicus]|uniref:3-oxoacyl-[acyl-carrier-protein] reductase FabG n=1 Tax=Stratiformator vulcanicus TaxID=2527980 RepID=A0A517R6B4_9PLAN|nr:SDR family NAD(P)-dependent oxidoreductase [Stratiformator vulcanicus]QDT39402.1 3-oxoacyl-[acyl-carrier-protein] reductase FabG [Stratiformator vulcanicus]